MRDKGIWKILAILAVLVMVGNSVAMPYSDLEYGMDKLSPSGERIRLKPPYVFSTDDIQAICWLEDESFLGCELTGYLELPDAYKEMVFTFKWYDPYGNIVGVLPSGARPTERVAGWCSGMYCECGMYISGYPPASKPGEWRVKVYRNDDYLFTKYFSISRHQTPTPTPTPTPIPTPTPTPTPTPIPTPSPLSIIQFKIDAANPGDTIIIKDGIYKGSIEVNKRLTIRSENGSANCIVQAADSSHHVFKLTADYVTISGFTVKGADGIHLYNADYCNISGNNCSHNKKNGIYLFSSSSNSIANNTCSHNADDGIHLSSSSSNSIANNTCLHNADDGIHLSSSSSNSIANNTCSHNADDGIYLYRYYSSSNSIANNTCSHNADDGIYLFSSSSNSIANNTCSHNADDGIYLSFSDSNSIYLNNFMNNTRNDYTRDSTNTWNSKEKITYTYNGSTHTNYLGNYWDDYNGTDANNDGIGSTPYSIDTDKDYYPLMEPFENYFSLTKKVFDTGQPKNPYPSISGTHSGTTTHT